MKAREFLNLCEGSSAPAAPPKPTTRPSTKPEAPPAPSTPKWTHPFRRKYVKPGETPRPKALGHEYFTAKDLLSRVGVDADADEDLR